MGRPLIAWMLFQSLTPPVHVLMGPSGKDIECNCKFSMNIMRIWSLQYKCKCQVTNVLIKNILMRCNQTEFYFTKLPNVNIQFYFLPSCSETPSFMTIALSF